MVTREGDSGDVDVAVKTRLLKVDQSSLSLVFVYHVTLNEHGFKK